MRLNELKPNPGSKSKKIRKGKGHASGLGKTSGRGIKGQKSRSGVAEEFQKEDLHQIKKILQNSDWISSRRLTQRSLTSMPLRMQT